jgi:hypothetical protein
MTGSWLMFGIFRQSAKDSMESYIQSPLSKNDKVDFVITPQNAALFNVENDELSFQGILYDIVGKKQIADTSKITCLMDDNETALVNDYNNVYFNNIQQKKQGTVNPFQFFLSIYESAIIEICSLQLIFLQPHCCLYKDASIFNAIFTIVKPPPKVLFA